MDQDGTLHRGGPRSRPHCARWGHSSPSQKRGHSPLPFLAHVYCDQTAGWIKMPLGTEVGLGPGDVVFDGDPAPPKRGTAPQFSAHVYCDRTAGWIKIPFGTNVGLGPCHIVLDEDPASPPTERGTAAPLFWVHVYCGYSRPSQLLLSSCCKYI